MKKTKITYWIFTIILCLGMLFSALSGWMQPEEAAKGMHEHLGYPLYFIPFLGIAKILGIIALLTPRFPRLKEWAYAGFTFDLIGATYSVIQVDGFHPQTLFMLVFFILLIGSYVSYHKMTKTIPANA